MRTIHRLSLLLDAVYEDQQEFVLERFLSLIGESETFRGFKSTHMAPLVLTSFLVEGRNVTGFPNEWEEGIDDDDLMPDGRKLPYWVEDEVKAVGANWDAGTRRRCECHRRR